jgi:uncharacterized membrane protein YhhN
MSTAFNTDLLRGKPIVLLFFILLLADVMALSLGYEQVRHITKPLLVPALAFYLIRSIKITKPVTWVVPALFFSWLGDILLMFDSDPMFFLLGLSSFLIAHICYIVLFRQILKDQQISIRWTWLIVVIAYYAVLIAILFPYLEDMRIPVIIYGLAISAMLFLALQMLYSPHQAGGRMIALGAVLFIISDSILAINKFYQPFQSAGILIMVTYGLAQLFIVAGTIAFMRSVSSGTSAYLSMENKKA